MSATYEIAVLPTGRRFTLSGPDGELIEVVDLQGNIVSRTCTVRTGNISFAPVPRQPCSGCGKGPDLRAQARPGGEDEILREA